jgi:hypothetical protein
MLKIEIALLLTYYDITSTYTTRIATIANGF